jgi:hypothetical protein
MTGVTRDGLRTTTGEDIDGMIDRLERLAADLKALRDGADPSALAADATILDGWMEHYMPIPVLVGGANGHPTLPGKGRLIRTSDLWVMAEDHGCARSMAKWYRLGRPLEAETTHS